MNNIFKHVQAKRPNSNTFDLSHDRKLSCNPGELIPVLMEEAIPGDHWRVKSSLMVRFAPMIAPIMHQVNAYMHFYFVPNRLLWDNWEDFISDGEGGNDESVYPYFNLNALGQPGDLFDYLGYPLNTTTDVAVSAMPIAAYNLIWDEYYRDQNLQDKVDVELVDGLNVFVGAPITIKNRAWQHDYFTSALPFLQKGPEVTLPLGTTAPITADSASITHSSNAITSDVVVADRITNIGASPTGTAANGDLGVDVDGDLLLSNSSADGKKALDNSANLRVDTTSWFANLAQATASSINDLRRAFKLQEWFEKNARGGSRYTETIRSHFGVRSSDARLQRPEYIGGSKVPITISEVLQTSESNEASTPQGNMAGHGIGYGNSGSASKFCEEHGWIVGILSVMPKTAYQDGVPKKYLKFDKFDHYWPSFAHIGEQAIKNVEVQVNHADRDGDFGYIPRYSEYKFINSSVHGDFKETLDFWHWGRKLPANVALNSQFIECVPDTRIFAVQDNAYDKLWIHVYHKISVKRLMPFFGNPKI